MTRSLASPNHGKRSSAAAINPPRAKVRSRSKRDRYDPSSSQASNAFDRPSTPSLGATREDDGQKGEESEASQEYFDAQSQLVEQEQIEKDREYAPGLSLGQDGSIENKDERHFPIMDLPPELRLNIYRCCLTRPFNILLSKLPPLPRNMSSLSEEDDTQSAFSTYTEAFDGDANPMPPRSQRDLEAQRARQPHEGGGPATTPIRNRAVRRSRPVRRLRTREQSDTTISGNTVASASSSRAARAWSRSDSVLSDRARIAAFELQRHQSATGEPEHRPQNDDPLLVAILRTSKQIYKEARSILYNENLFTLDLGTAQATLSGLHQRSRMQIRHLELTIPTHTDIIDRFAEVVRLSLRYCWGLKRFVIHLPFVLPGLDDSSITNYPTTVFANAFDILRWLPQDCEVQLTGNVCREISQVVEKNAQLSQSLNKHEYARRQLISTEVALGLA